MRASLRRQTALPMSVHVTADFGVRLSLQSAVESMLSSLAACLLSPQRSHEQVVKRPVVTRAAAGFAGWGDLTPRPSPPERSSNSAPPENSRDRRRARRAEENGAESDSAAGDMTPRRAAAEARRAFTWDEQGVYLEEAEEGGSRSSDESLPSRSRVSESKESRRSFEGREAKVSQGQRPPFGQLRRPARPPPGVSGAARRVAEKQQQQRGPGGTAGRGGAGGRASSPQAARPSFDRKARFKIGRREDSVEELREREASVTAMPLPLPMASATHANLFVRLGLSHEAGAGLEAAGVARPTDIQTRAIPALVQGMSAAVLAETGSGKTLAYCLPLATRLYAYKQLGKSQAMRRVPATACPEALIIVPNRELGIQVAASAEAAAVWCQPEDAPRTLCVVRLLGKEKAPSPASRKGAAAAPAPSDKRDVTWAGAEGGELDTQKVDPQAAAAAFEAADIVVATPRTALTLQKTGRLRLGRCRVLIVDEADELLSAGFIEDVSKLVRSAAGEAGVGVFGQQVQLVCVAATLSRETWDETIKPTFPVKMQRITSQGLHRPAPGVAQVRAFNKIALLRLKTH